MSELRTRKCCPSCNSVAIHRRIRTHSYHCNKCKKDIPSTKELSRCPLCKSRALHAIREGKYICSLCNATFNFPASKPVKDCFGPVPAALQPNAEVQA